MSIDVPIRGETIRLDQMLKLADLAQTGGHAKILIAEGLVAVNGMVERRRRRTLWVDDEVRVALEDEDDDATLHVVAQAG